MHQSSVPFSPCIILGAPILASFHLVVSVSHAAPWLYEGTRVIGCQRPPTPTLEEPIEMGYPLTRGEESNTQRSKPRLNRLLQTPPKLST